MKVSFYLSRPEAKEESSIFLRACYNREKLKLTTAESINPRHWNKKRHEARQTPAFPESPEFNRRLAGIASKVNGCYLHFKNENEGAEPAPDILRKLIEAALGRNREKRLGFKGYFEQFINRQREGLRVSKGGIINPETAKHYGTTLNTILAFSPDIDFKGISLSWYNDFLAYLQKQQYSKNTIGVHIQRLKTVLAEGEANGYPVNPDYKSKYFVKLAEVADNVALTESELQALAAFDLTGNKRLEAVRDLFVVGCHTGLRYSDFSRLTDKHLKAGFIHIEQQKTGNPVVIPIHPVVAGIVEQYGGNLPPAISNQKTNDYLKEICKLLPALQVKDSKTSTVGGKKVTVAMERWQLISSHTARRTFATIQYHKGLPSLTIMAITGHKTEKQFLQYIKVNPAEHAYKMRDMWAKEAGPVMKAV